MRNGILGSILVGALVLGVILVTVKGCAVLVVALSESIEARQAEWDQFVEDHNCEVVERRDGQTTTGYGYGFNQQGQYGQGFIVASSSDQEAWKCDDGVIYWRDAR